VSELDAHSLFGAMQTRASHEWFKEQNKKTMIIARSSYAGAGKFASRWLGDNFASFEFMTYSITGVMMSNVMGIPFAGADICGFLGQTNPELCTRWHFLGAFYPFSRNHNSIDVGDQEPYVWKNATDKATNRTYMSYMRDAIRLKYTMVPYYYTQLSLLSSDGGTFFKPPFFAFPTDEMAYANVTNNFMLGEALKVSIQATDNNASLPNATFYFPNETTALGGTYWCRLFDSSERCFEGGASKTYNTSIYDYAVHLRSGYIVPLQDAWALVANTTGDLEAAPTDLHINPACWPEMCDAAGWYYGDDGESLNSSTQVKSHVKMHANTRSFSSAANSWNFNVTFESTSKGDPMPCDFVGTMFIYNAEFNKLTADYDLTYCYSGSKDCQQVKNATTYD